MVLQVTYNSVSTSCVELMFQAVVNLLIVFFIILIFDIFICHRIKTFPIFFVKLWCLWQCIMISEFSDPLFIIHVLYYFAFGSSCAGA